ncbi:MAG: hypothetical protein NUW08_02550 [Candidatus Uhrbacteria bacterium]|nr:hypothetical protein [Candidatus Uhrbacteria bacterium]
MPRTLPELLREMERLTKGLPDAWKLTRRFKTRAVAHEWDPSDEYDPEGNFYFEAENLRKNPVVVVFLPEGVEAPQDDSIVWMRQVSYGDRDAVPALFVDAVPCHNDWLALKAVHEYGNVEIGETLQELAREVVRRDELPLSAVAFLLTPASASLNLYHEILLSCLMDRRLRGRIMNRVKSLKLSARSRPNEEALALQLINDVHRMLPFVWPESANREEDFARYELLRSVARAIVLHDFCDAIVLH